MSGGVAGDGGVLSVVGCGVVGTVCGGGEDIVGLLWLELVVCYGMLGKGGCFKDISLLIAACCWMFVVFV